MSVRITISGRKLLKKNFDDISNEMEKQLMQAVNTGGQIIRSEAVKEISRGARSGRKYKRGKGRVHVASAPGEYPKTDYGELVSNITVEPDGKLAVTVGSRANAPHGYHLEVKNPADGGRRWLKPTYDKHISRVIKIIETAARGVFSKRRKTK